MIRELLFLSLGAAVLAQWEIVPVFPEKRSSWIRVCGNELHNILALVCNSTYNQPFPMKKSFDGLFYPEYNPNDVTEGKKGSIMFPYSTRTKAHSILNYRRIRRGVNHECCKKSCKLSEIMSYCRY